MIKYYKAKYDKKLNKGVYGVSLVGSPAMEGKAIFLNKHNHQVKFKTIDEERRIVFGMILQPDFDVYRYDEETGEEYFISFDKETIYNLAHDFMSNGYNNNSSLEHKTKIEGVSIVETWVVEDSEKDKTSFFGLNEKVGSWVGMMKVENSNVWENYCKTGKIGGFSVDAFIGLEEVKRPKNELKDGTPITFSGIMFCKGDSLYYMDGEPLKTGKYELATEVEVDIIDGVVQSIKEINLKSIEMSKEVLEEAQKQTSILTELATSIKSLFLNSDKGVETVEVKLGSVKSKDGSITFEFDGETAEVGASVYVMSEDGQKVPVPVGEYELEGEMILVVEPEGVIAELKPANAEAPAQEEMNTETGSISNDAKAVEEITNAIKSILIKYEAQEKEIVDLKTQLSKMEKESEGVKTLLSETPAKKPIRSQVGQPDQKLSLSERLSQKLNN